MNIGAYFELSLIKLILILFNYIKNSPFYLKLIKKYLKQLILCIMSIIFKILGFTP
jgi:hypothetical protein